MENKESTNPQDLQIQGLIDRYLRSKVSSNDFALRERHLDEDLLTAFTEGNFIFCLLQYKRGANHTNKLRL